MATAGPDQRHGRQSDETTADERVFQRTAGLLAILSAAVAFGAFALILLATDFNPEAVGDPRVLLTVGAEGASQMRWGLVLNMFGYYLLLVPMMLVLRAWLRPASPGFVDLFTLGGLAYSLVGAMGSAMLAAVWPALMTEYAEAAGQQRQAIEAAFVGLTNAIQIGLWNILELFPGGVWWLGIGLLLWRERRLTAIFTSLLGVVTLLGAIGWYLNLADLARGFVMVYVMLAPLWALWIGIVVLRRPLPATTPASHAEIPASSAR